MTTWSKTPPSEPGWYWYEHRELGRDPVVKTIFFDPDRYTSAGGASLLAPRFGPRIPSPEDIEAAKDALREARGLLRVHTGAVQRAAANACDAALAKLEGRS